MYIQSWKELIETMRADISNWKPYGLGGGLSVCSRFVILFRLCSFFKNKKPFHYRIVFFICRIIYKHYQIKTGIQLPIGTFVGKGLFFPHYSCIVINGDSIIGSWCTIYQGTTIGKSKGGGCPKIGNNCCIYAGAKIVGGVEIGDNVIVGANSVVTKSIQSNDVVAGVPAKSIKRFVLNV